MYQLNEGILQGKTFGFDKSGNIVPNTFAVSDSDLKNAVKQAVCNFISELQEKTMELNESIKQALNDSEVKKAIKDQIDLVTESKANERVQSLLK